MACQQDMRQVSVGLVDNHRLLRDFDYWCDGDFDRPCTLSAEDGSGDGQRKEKGSFQGIKSERGGVSDYSS